MDFLNDAINAEISKKRKTLETAKNGNAKKKYVSRAELERMREEEYLRQEAEQRAKELEVCISLSLFLVHSNHLYSTRYIIYRKSGNDKKKKR